VHPRRQGRALLRGPSTSPLEVAVETFSFAPWMTARAKRLRLYRLVANSFWFLLGLILLANLLRWAIPQLGSILGYLFLPLGILMPLLGIPWLIISWGFSSGTIKCPSCDARFAPKFWPWVPKSCQNCHYDIYTLRHRGDF
jgi:hypothetical protein